MKRRRKMPRFRPNPAESGGNQFGGFMNGLITGYKDRSDEFDWAEVFIDVIFDVPNSQYPVIYSLKGKYDREDNGNIKSCSMLNRIYYLFDAIGFKGGPNVIGDWEDENGNKIDNIETFLNQNYSTENTGLDPDSYPYHIFTYKEWVDKAGKAYTRVCPKVVLNTEKGKADLKSYVAFLRQKNIIKEYTGENPTSTDTVSDNTALNF
tara:strand:+ start:469 stop:1089 length:621 start_codon:yes stop_codon:yes gene_type:complete